MAADPPRSKKIPGGAYSALRAASPYRYFGDHGLSAVKSVGHELNTSHSGFSETFLSHQSAAFAMTT